MKLKTTIVLILAALFISMAGSAQTDSLRFSSETHNESVVKYLTPMEYAFMFHEETDWLFKGSMSAFWEYGRVAGSLKLSLEKKIAQGFSLNAVLIDLTAYNYGFSSIDADGTESSLESRWYYKYNKNIREHIPTANLSGAYIALGAGYGKAYNAIWYPDTEHSDLKFIPIFAKWGVQRRFLKRGFVDVGLKAGWNKSLSGDLWSTLFFNTFVDVGLAFTKDKYKLDFDRLCPVLRCHAEDRFLLKTNLVNIINLAYMRKTLIGSIEPNIAAEFKLGSSPFSINTLFISKIQYSKSNYDIHKFESFSVIPELTIEGRYYYNLHRRILMGKSGNGLSANYISLGATYRGEFYNSISNGFNDRQKKSFTGIKVGAGIQRLISKHLYLDINISGAFGTNYYYDGWTRPNRNKTQATFDLGFGIGYRF